MSATTGRKGHTVTRIGERKGGESWQRFALVVRAELQVGDPSGDLAERGFRTVEHEPCKPGTLTLSMVSEYGSGQRDNWSSTPGGFAEQLAELDTFAAGWDREKAQRLSDIGERWHLNTMRAGCAHMTPVDVGTTVTYPTAAGPLDLFTVARYVQPRYAWVDRNTREEIEHKDARSAKCPTCGHSERLVDYVQMYDGVDHYGANRGLVCAAGSGYTYGSAWLVEPLPADVLAELADLVLLVP